MRIDVEQPRGPMRAFDTPVRFPQRTLDMLANNRIQRLN